jgi:hypothetical protein
MPIVFNCDKCGKSIKAPDEAGGKWGVCPGCKGRCYVPLPLAPEDDDELKLAPIDESEEEKLKRLADEDRRIRESIWEQRQEPDDPNERFKKKPPQNR